MSDLSNASPVGRLLEELSWEGNAKKYRDGGRGKENVLTVEALTPLDYLPRDLFLGRVITAAHGATEARARLVSEIEDVATSVLSGDIELGRSGVTVQPDALITGPSTYVLVEAKRIRRSSFQERQLAREFVAVLQEAADRTPLLLVILGSPPPVVVRGFPDRVDPATAIAGRLNTVEGREGLGLSDDELVARAPEILAWTTWSEIRDVVVQARDEMRDAGELSGTVDRLCEAVVTAIEWHA